MHLARPVYQRMNSTKYRFNNRPRSNCLKKLIGCSETLTVISPKTIKAMFTHNIVCDVSTALSFVREY